MSRRVWTVDIEQACERVAKVLNARKGFSVEDIDPRDRRSLLTEIVCAVLEDFTPTTKPESEPEVTRGLSFSSALASGYPMRRPEPDDGADETSWLWRVLDLDGDWLGYDPNDDETVGLHPCPLLPEDYFAHDWMILASAPRKP